MNTYERIFGTGPRGLVISILLLIVAYLVEPHLNLPIITTNSEFRIVSFGVFTVLTTSIVLWSIKSLPPTDRGKQLVTSGAFKWFRHPLYAAFLTYFNFGLALLLNNWIYIVWALAQHPIWHWNIRAEEALVRDVFGKEYDYYAERTGRFLPLRTIINLNN